MILLQLAIVFLTFESILSFDEAIWHYIGRNWFRFGLTPYTGGVDNKSPLIYMIYGISDLLFGVNYWFPRVLAIGCQSIGIYFVYRITKHISGQQGGILAMAIYGLSLLWRSTNGKMVSLTQTYEITFLVISFYFYLKGHKRIHLLASGCMIGIAFIFRFSAGFGILALVFASIQRRSISDLFYFLFGTLVTIGFFIIVFVLAGINLHDLLIYSLLDNFVIGSVTAHPLAWKIEQFINAFFYSELILFYPFLLTYILIKRKLDIFMLWFLSALTAITVIGMFAQAHLKELLPPFSIMSAISLAWLINNYKIPFGPVLIVIAISFFPKTIEPFFGAKKLFVSKHLYEEQACKESKDEDSKKKLGLWIRSNTTPGQAVFVAGYGAQVQVYTERLSPTIYFNLTQTAIAKKRLFVDLSVNKPTMMVIPLLPKYAAVDADIRAFTDEIVAKSYYHVNCLYGYNIYRLRSAL